MQTRLTLRPGQRGTKRLARRFGDRLVWLDEPVLRGRVKSAGGRWDPRPRVWALSYGAVRLASHTMLKSLGVVAALALAQGALAQGGVSYPAMTNEGFDHMAGTYGFYIGQAYSVEALAERFPDLRGRLSRAQASFDAEFAASVRNIDAILTAESRTWPNGAREELTEAVRSQLDLSTITRADADAFAEEVERRASGEIPSPYLETFLIYRPDFFERPAEEFFRAYRKTFRTGDHPKSKGVDFQVEYPISWASAEGRRPNVIAMFTSENGRGLETVSLIVIELPVDAAELEGATGQEMLDAELLQMFVPSSGRVLSAVPIRLDRLEGGKLTFTLEERYLDQTVMGRTAAYAVLYQNKLIVIQGSVGGVAQVGGDVEARFEKFAPLFDQIANSLVVQSQW